MTFAGFVFVFIAHKKKRKRQNIIDILCTYGSSAIMYAHRSVIVIVTKKLL